MFLTAVLMKIQGFQDAMLCDWASCLCACHEGTVVYLNIQTQNLYIGMPVNKISWKINKPMHLLHLWSSSAAQITSAAYSALILLHSLSDYSRVSMSITLRGPDFNIWWSPILMPLCETFLPGSDRSGWHLAGKLTAPNLPLWCRSHYSWTQRPYCIYVIQ